MKSFQSQVFCLIALSLVASSCRDFSVDGGASALSCAASSVAIANTASLGIMDPTLGRNGLAQSFKPQSSIQSVSSINLPLQAVVPTGMSFGSTAMITVIILPSKANGDPDIQNPVSSAASVAANTISTKNGQSVTFNFGKSFSLSSDQTYWIFAEANYNWNAGLHVIWMGSDSNTYSDGNALVYDGSLWTSPDAPSSSNNRDLGFQIGCL